MTYLQTPPPGTYYPPLQIPLIPTLSADSFRVIMTDSLGCSDTTYFIINEPNPITINYNTTNTTSPFSNDGSIFVTVSGGTPGYSYSWTGPNNYTSNTSAPNNLDTGAYTLIVTDANGCQDSIICLIESNQSCSAGIYSIDSISCNGDSTAAINVNDIFGVPPFQYKLEFLDTSGSFIAILDTNIIDTFFVFSNLYSGFYRYTLSDHNNCADTINITVTETLPITITQGSITNASDSSICDGSISVNVNGGTAPYNYAWSNGGTTSQIDFLCVGTYCVDVTDINGCSVISWCEDIIESPCNPTFVINY